MPDLIAQGPQLRDRWRRRLPAGRKLVLGRAAGAWSTPWDDRISRQHVEFCWREGRLEVTKVPSARNPVFYSGRQQEQFDLLPGEHFVIGGTTFSLVDDQVQVWGNSPHPVSQQSFSPDYLKSLRFRDADQRIDVLSRLPELISDAASDDELFVRLVTMLLSGIPMASAAAIVRLTPASNSRVEVLHWDRRQIGGDDFRPSERLIREAIQGRESVVHVWGSTEQAAGRKPVFTVADDADWALATPIEGEACRGWALYVAGRFDATEPAAKEGLDPRDLRDDLKFTELVASSVGNLRNLRLLERKEASLRQFFSPLVLQALAGQNPDVVLAPRETEVSVLFCDLRGFSRESERLADNLLDLLERVSRALGVTTRQILDAGGVVGDFHGDAAMGFWGWPLPQQDSVLRAATAALAIRAEFTAASQRTSHPLADFHIGIGVATGRAVAGKIGTVDQVKATVFGPVVNLASRLEGMTRILRASILIDPRTAEEVRRQVPTSVARVRRVAVVRPYGLATSLEVSELLPPASEYPALSDAHLAAYEEALDHLLEGNWNLAFQSLHKVPADDRVKDFLTVFIAQHHRIPPPNWDGVIPLESK